VEPSLDFATVPESVAGKSRDGTSSDRKTARLQDYLDCLVRAQQLNSPFCAFSSRLGRVEPAVARMTLDAK